MSLYKVSLCRHRRYKPVSNQAPEPIKMLYTEYSTRGVFGAEELKSFMVEVQQEAETSTKDAEDIIDAQREFRWLSLFRLSRFRRGMSFGSFFHFLFTERNPPTLPVHQDMNAPLAHYFIYTGHNSYLTGSQLSSDRFVFPIVEALKRGVRVIDLDLWPNAKKDDVDVLHGRITGTPVELLKCLVSIKEHAFTASPYPVIITLEDHLTPDLQAKVAKMLTETFGDMLFVPETEFLEEFPSPESLKMRILISTKPPEEYLDSIAGKEKDHESQKGSEDDLPGVAEVSDSKLDIPSYSKTDSERTLEDEDPYDRQHAPEYKHLIGIVGRKKKGSMTEPLIVDPHKVTCVSLSEETFNNVAKNHGTELLRFTQRNLLRIYPKGTRVTWSTYEPLPCWIHGAQMVAFNMQGDGESLWLMQGLFRANGGCGYVKKPHFLFGEDPDIINPRARLPRNQTLMVWVYMGDGWLNDFKRPGFYKFVGPDFSVKVGIAGVPNDTVMKQTIIIGDNWTPVWNEQFEFRLTVPELALLRIEVVDKVWPGRCEYHLPGIDGFGGQTCLPVWELRPGIRTVPLCDRKGDTYKSVKLLMRFEIIPF